jgi:tRNA(Ile)-lysidine synthase
MQLLERVRAFIRQRDLIDADARVAAAVSGGSDSVALLHILRELDAAGDLRLAGVAHFNHQLRPAADDDERFVEEHARDLGVPFVSDREDIAARATRERRSIEDAARRGRHEFFDRARAALGADVVALGHTRDDQAETFLLRLVRGAGPRGLGGMHAKHGAIVRPLLACGRSELRAWLAERGCRFVEDETNSDLAVPRNRVRHELLPLIAAHFNPSIVDTLAGEAELLQEQWAWMEEASAPFLATPAELDVAELKALPPALQRIVVWRAMTAVSGGRTIGFDHASAALRLIESGGAVDAPGVRMQRIGGKVVLLIRGSRGSRGSRGALGAQGSGSVHLANPANQFEYQLSIPGEVLVAEAGWRVSAENAQDRATIDASAVAGNGAMAFVRRDLVRESLVVRNRRPGDRFRPVGLGGSKKVQDLFVDRKLPRGERDGVPLVVDGSDRIVWVAGYGIDEAFRVTDSSQAVLVLRLTRD